MLNVLTIDIEDWFHICGIQSLKPIEEWDNYESRVLNNTTRLLEILKKKNITATFFVLGWIAEKHPEVIEQILKYNNNHEIASHGYSHKLIYEMTPREFENDLLKSIIAIKKCIGESKDILGYRAPSFSINNKTEWAFKILIRNGIKYDSSIFSGIRGQGGIIDGKYNRTSIFPIKRDDNKLIEIPFAMGKLFMKNIAPGGGYFRIFPYIVTRRIINNINNIQKKPAIFYLHPRDIDPYQPTLKMSMYRHLKSYSGLKSTSEKLYKLLKDFKWISMRSLLISRGLL